MEIHKRIKSSVVAVLILMGLALGGCRSKELIKDTKAEAYAKPSLEFRGIFFEDQSFDGMSVVFKFALVSKDKRPVTIKDCSYTLELQGEDASHGKIKAPAELSSKAQVPLLAKLSIPWPSDNDRLLAFLEKKRIPYKYQLQCDLRTSSEQFDLRGADAGSIPLPKLPQLDVNQANAERFGKGKEARINFELCMVNENPFEIHLEKIEYKVFLDESEVTQGQIPLAEIIPASAEFTYDVATPIFNQRDNKEILEMLSNPEIQYRLQGDVFLGKFKLPLNATGTISFYRTSP